MTITVPFWAIGIWLLIGLLTDLTMEYVSRTSSDRMALYDFTRHRLWLLASCLAFWPYIWWLMGWTGFKKIIKRFLKGTR